MKAACALLFAVVLMAGCQANTFTHKRFHERIAGIHTVALPPGQVRTAVLDKIVAPEPFVPLPDEPSIAREVTCAIIDELLRRSFAVVEIPAVPVAPAATNCLWDARSQMVYFDVPFNMPRPEARTIATNQGTQAVVYFNISAFKSTGRRETWGTVNDTVTVLGALGGASGPWVSLRQAVVQITLVDGNTGEVLWIAGGDFGSFDTVKPARAVEQLFERFPVQLPKEHP